MAEFSVIIPSYNHAAYIREAVESVLSQSFHDLELIVVDDGSMDESLEILKKFADPRMRVITQSNHGAHIAINRGLDEATGKYLTILNSDDVFHLNRLQVAKTILDNDPGIGLIGSFIQIIDQRGKSLGIKHGYKDCPPWELNSPERSFRNGNDLRKVLLTENYFSTTSNLIFRPEIYRKLAGFRPLRYAHDWDFAIRAAKLARIELIPDALVKYRVHSTNTIRENHAAMVFEICWILAVHLPGSKQEQVHDIYGQELPTDKLLHSIYCFGMDKVLAIMLLQNLAGNQQLALELLDPNNSERGQYMNYINEVLEQDPKGSPGSLKTGWGSLLRNRLTRR